MTDAQRIKNLTVPEGRIDVALDTDAYNEIDDQFAIAYLLNCEEKLNIKEIYAAPFFNNKSTSPEDGMERSCDEIVKLLTFAGREDLLPVIYRGSRTYLPSETTPVESPADRALVALSQNYTTENPLYVVAIGAITNVASALLLDPTLKELIVLVWLGGHAMHYPHTREFNMYQDVAGARIVFGCGVPLVQLPCFGIVDQFRASGPELTYWLEGKNPLADYLAKNTVAEAESYAKGTAWTQVIWDVTAVAWLMNDGDRFMKSRLIPAPIPEYDDHYSADYRRHLIRYVTEINHDALMTDMMRHKRINARIRLTKIQSEDAFPLVEQLVFNEDVMEMNIGRVFTAKEARQYFPTYWNPDVHTKSPARMPCI